MAKITDELYSKPLTAEELKAAKSNGYEWESMFYEANATEANSPKS